MKTCPRHTNFAKVAPRFSQIGNKPSKIAQYFQDFAKNGEILPNLVTLVTTTQVGGTYYVHIIIRSFRARLDSYY